MKILVGCNLLTSVNSMVYPSHMQFWASIGRNFGLNDVIFFSPRRMSIDRMRNEAARMSLEYECDYLFFYDDDVSLPSDTLSQLIVTMKQTECMVVGGLTLVRSYPFKPMVFKYVAQTDLGIWSMTTFSDYKKEINDNGVVMCDALGFSCCLIDTRILKEIKPPYFVTGPENTEDVYFCHKINTEYQDNRICVDTKITTGHTLDHYYVSPENKQQFVRLEKGLYNQFPGMKLEGKNREDRDAHYREQVMERIRRVQAAM